MKTIITYRQAIVTKYLGPTNVKGSRVKATAQAGSVTLSWDDAANSAENHAAAAQALVRRFGWAAGQPRLVGGAGPRNEYVWALVDKEDL